MPRPSRSTALLCITIVAFGALLPGVSALAAALVEPQWILLPDLPLTVLPTATNPSTEQPLSLLSLLPPRAPPAFALA